MNIRVGDFVYLHEEAVGQGRKLQANHSGPYTVNEIQSPHLIKPEGKRKCRMPVHIPVIRLKMAYIRAPEPAPYLRHTSDNDHNQSTTNNSPTSTESDQPTVPLRRSRRNIQRPIRFRDYPSPDSVLGTSSLSSDENHHHKIKRILARKKLKVPMFYI